MSSQRWPQSTFFRCKSSKRKVQRCNTLQRPRAPQGQTVPRRPARPRPSPWWLSRHARSFSNSSFYLASWRQWSLSEVIARGPTSRSTSLRADCWTVFQCTKEAGPPMSWDSVLSTSSRETWGSCCPGYRTAAASRPRCWALAWR